MNQPLVSVVALCYNHAEYIWQSIESVIKQTYPRIQLILVDDHSADDSWSTILEIQAKYPTVETLLLEKNMGNCRAFNLALQKVKGDFVIDFATDDIMLPDRIQRQVEFFLSKDTKTGVVFSDASYIDASGNRFRNHFDYLKKKNLLTTVPHGDVFRDVLKRYFIPSPTMMYRREVLESLNGYDENLAYEDFDFWVRASRHYQFEFLDEITTLIRRAGNSMSSGWYKKGDNQLHSTYLVCQKAKTLCRDDEDRAALSIRVAYEYRQSAFSENKREAELFGALLLELRGKTFQYRVIKVLTKIPLPWAWIRMQYHRLRYG